MCFYLGQNIDVISCICNVLVIGFCVDYCVHIAHAYLVSYGDRYTKKGQNLGPRLREVAFPE